jgi:hypothetical protein
MVALFLSAVVTMRHEVPGTGTGRCWWCRDRLAIFGRELVKVCVKFHAARVQLRDHAVWWSGPWTRRLSAALGEVLAEQPVSVLIRWPLPRAGLVAEVRGHARRGGDLGVQRHHLALALGQ